MSRQRPALLQFTLVCCGSALIGAIFGWWCQQSRLAELRVGLGETARRAAVAFDAAELNRLAGTPADAGTPAYAAVRDRLERLRRLDPRWRWVQLFRREGGSGRAVLLAEAAESGIRSETLPGGEFTEAETPPDLSSVLRSGLPAVDGPRLNRLGSWITGYAAIGGSAGTERPATFIGLGVRGADWSRDAWQAALIGSAGAWAVLAVPLIGWWSLRRKFGTSEVVRNLAEAMEQSRSAIMILDLQNRIEYVNRGICEQLGYSRAELIQRRWRDLEVAEIGQGIPADLFATMQAGRPWEGEWTSRRKDGTTYPVRGGVSPVRRGDGSIACFVAVFDDMTEAKVREAELREARDQAQVGDRAKGHFLATMSHEVRTPLNGIVGFTSLLLETSLTSEQREYVQTIRMSTEALIQLTGDILDFARIESGKLKLDRIATDPRECVEDALDLHAAKAADKGIELLHHFAPDLPATVVADGGRLRQVLVNLIGNAVKFTERGEVEVRVRRLPAVEETAGRDGAAEGCQLEFTVRDTGIGIAAENLSKLFRPFSQVDESTTRRYGGTGLGLAICQNLIDLMDGTIGVSSEPGRGSIFRFVIRAPAAAPEPSARILSGVQVALVIRSRALRRELVDLVQGWQGGVVEIDDLAQLSSTNADVAVVEVDLATAREFAARLEPPTDFNPAKLFGLVPISLSNDLRNALRAHFRLLVNKPVHHDAFFALLAGSWGSIPHLQPPVHFGYRVLVVDDNQVNQRLVQRVLANLGCSATVMGDGRRAIDFLALRAAEFDLVLLDLQTPDLDGFGALRAIRSGQAGQSVQAIWVIALTSDLRDEPRRAGLAEGLNDYLTKPLRFSEIEASLKRFRAHRAATRR